jgi:tRNA threonylcarbamoyladenosine biosynthesis protein TsaB
MHVLALDTATPEPAVAVSSGESARVERLPDDRRASEDLVAAISACLRGAGLDLSDCGRIAVSSGPGSFTGVRVGLATAWGLSRATGIAVEAVPTLEALAEAARRPALTEVAAALDAGRGDVTIECFSLAGTRAASLDGSPRRLSREDALRHAAGREIVSLPAGLLPGAAAPPVTIAQALAGAVALSPGATSQEPARAVYSRPSAAEEKLGAP